MQKEGKKQNVSIPIQKHAVSVVQNGVRTLVSLQEFELKEINATDARTRAFNNEPKK